MPRAHRAKKTRRYSDEFKSTAVVLSLADGVQVQTVAEALDIHPFMLSRWRRDYREGRIRVEKRSTSSRKAATESRRVQELEVEVQRLKKENAVLKKWQRFVAEQRPSATRSSPATDPSSE